MVQVRPFWCRTSRIGAKADPLASAALYSGTTEGNHGRNISTFRRPLTLTDTIALHDCM